MFGLLVLASIVVGTWNGNWFPSGRAEHRANPDVEAATIAAAAKMLRTGLDEIDPRGTNDVILCLHEMRGPRVASNLVAQIGRRGLKLAVISGYRRRDRFDMQQDAIATTLPVAEASWSTWHLARNRRETPPRGYAFAALALDPATTAAVYAVHLKSNYGTGRNPELAALCRTKRTHAVRQLVDQESSRRGRKTRPVIVAGDFNADKWRKEFAQEEIFDLFDAAGFRNWMELLPASARGTHPNERYGDSTLDYIVTRNFANIGLPRLVPNDRLSDHFAVFALLKLQ